MMMKGAIKLMMAMAMMATMMMTMTLQGVPTEWAHPRPHLVDEVPAGLLQDGEQVDPGVDDDGGAADDNDEEAPVGLL